MTDTPSPHPAHQIPKAKKTVLRPFSRNALPESYAPLMQMLMTAFARFGANGQEAVQEMMTRELQRQGKNIEDVADLEEWSLRVCANKLIDIQRAQKALKEKPLRSDYPKSGPSDAEVRAQEEESLRRHRALDAAIGTLPQKLRKVFVYCKNEHHTLVQASNYFQTSIGTVNGWLRQAYSLVRAELNRRGVTLSPRRKN